MLYNLRSDIIYYKAGSDFELEFNLCGCCRMRLLTDKPSNKKAFVHSLARAVSRSRVILIAGPLFGADSTIETVAQALGTTTETVDNTAYNIASEDEIAIIKGSLPLVSSDGSFGGCIIESGPQTMILLTDNKTLRKNIMTNLIHPYVSELYSAELKANTAEAQTKEEPFPAQEDLAVQENVLPTEDITEISTEEVADLEEATKEPAKEEIIEEETSLDDVIIIDTDKSDCIQEDDLKISELCIDELTEEPEEQAYVEDNSIILEVLENTSTNAEPISNAFNELYLEEREEETNLDTIRQQSTDYQVIYDDGEITDDNTDYTEERTSRLSIATIIVTAILLLSIIVLCITIFSASSNEGMAPAEYIRSVWQTVFG